MLDAALVFLAAAVAVADVAFLGTCAFSKKGKRGTSPEGHSIKSPCDNFRFLLFVPFGQGPSGSPLQQGMLGIQRDSFNLSSTTKNE